MSDREKKESVNKTEAKKKTEKKKKEKVTYIDDGRTIADMSGVGFGGYASRDGRRRSSFREKWRTYWEAVKMMFIPMLMVLGIISVTFLLLYLAMS